MNGGSEPAVPVRRAELEQLAMLLGPDSKAVSVLAAMQRREAQGDVVEAYYDGRQFIIHRL